MNRLIVRCHDEITALNDAEKVISGAERRSRLRQQAHSRAFLCRDLGAGVTALGGVPANRPTRGAKLASSLRHLKRMLTGAHGGDAYKACARATARTALACSAALEVELPGDVRFGLERQYGEIESDRKELRRLRQGATPTATAPRNVPEATDAANMRRDTAALESWSDDGGSDGGRTQREAPEYAGEMATSAPKVAVAAR
jgi:hypothetical protein